MSKKDPTQDSALDRLVKLVSVSTQQTVLTTVIDLIENQEYTTTPIRDWCKHEIERLDKIKAEL